MRFLRNTDHCTTIEILLPASVQTPEEEDCRLSTCLHRHDWRKVDTVKEPDKVFLPPYSLFSFLIILIINLLLKISPDKGQTRQREISLHNHCHKEDEDDGIETDGCPNRQSVIGQIHSHEEDHRQADIKEDVAQRIVNGEILLTDKV